jgi:hypothetical protein
LLLPLLQWRGLYEGDYLTNVQGGADWVRALAAALDAPGADAPLPAVSVTAQWYQWDKDWQGAPAVAAAYPLSQRFDPAVAFSVMPRANCVYADVDAGTCAPNPDGGVWAAGRGGAVTLQVMTSQTLPRAGRVVRYALGGAAPSAASPAYEEGHPLVLDALAAGARSVNITAAVFDESGAQVGGARTSVWRAA